MRTIFIAIVSILLGFGGFYLFSESKTRTKKNLPTPNATVTPIPFTIENPPTNSLIGMVTAILGDVKWQSRTASESARLLTPRQIQQGENVETGEEGNVTIFFSEQLEINVTEKSNLSFVQTLPANIVLAQTSGSVTYSKVGTVPVSIRSKRLLIDLVEGESTISLDEEDPIIKIRVVSGSVKLAYNDRRNVSQIVTVTEDEPVIYNDDLRTVE